METNGIELGYRYMGLATPGTNPGALTATDKIYYETYTHGIYTYMDGITVDENEYCYLFFDGTSWDKRRLFNSYYCNLITKAEVMQGRVSVEYDWDIRKLFVVVRKKTIAKVHGLDVDDLVIPEGRYPLNTDYVGEKHILVGITRRGGNIVFIDPEQADNAVRFPLVDSPYRDNVAILMRVEYRVLDNHECSEARVFAMIDSPCIGNNGFGMGSYYYRPSHKGNFVDLKTICTSIEDQLDGEWSDERIQNGYLGAATTGTEPVANPGRHKYYLSCLSAPGNYVFANFRGQNGQPVAVTTQSENENYALYNNGEYWKAVKLEGIASNLIKMAGFYTGVYIPKGTFLVEPYGLSNNELQSYTYIGENRETSRLVSIKNAAILGRCAKNLTLENILMNGTDYRFQYEVENVHFKGVGDERTYLLNFTDNVTLYVRNCIFDYRNIFTYVRGVGINNLEVTGCEFKGKGDHVFYMQNIKNGALIRNNTVSGEWVTGIFSGSNQVMPSENITIENNVLSGIKEEGIAFDGFGNNIGLQPNIVMGTITDCWNDTASEKLVIKADLYRATEEILGNDDHASESVFVSDRNDWTSFYFSFNESTGHDGLICKILGFDATNGTFTLDTSVLAQGIMLNGICGVQSGFFNCVVRDNILYNYMKSPEKDHYAVGISLYMNCFNCTVENNTIHGYPHGISLRGGIILTHHRVLAFNNIIRGNKIMGCKKALNLTSESADVSGYKLLNAGNMIENNIVDGGEVNLYHQKNLLFSNNQIKNAEMKMGSIYTETPAKADIGKIVLDYELDTNPSGGYLCTNAYKVKNVVPKIIKIVNDTPVLTDL